MFLYGIVVNNLGLYFDVQAGNDGLKGELEGHRPLSLKQCVLDSIITMRHWTQPKKKIVLLTNLIRFLIISIYF